MLKKITMLLIRNDAPGFPKKQHYMALSAGFTNSAPAVTGRKRKNSGESESGNDEFWFVTILLCLLWLGFVINSQPTLKFTSVSDAEFDC